MTFVTLYVWICFSTISSGCGWSAQGEFLSERSCKEAIRQFNPERLERYRCILK